MSNKPRPILAVILMFVVPILAGAALSPYVFNGLRELGTVTDALTKLTEAEFERVTNRCVLIIAVFMLYPVAKMTGMIPTVRRGIKPSPTRFRELRNSIVIACLSMIAIYGVGTWLGAYSLDKDYEGLGALGLTFVEYLIGAVFIGLFEEVFFRGFVFGALRSRMGFVKALLISSVIFSGIHFFRPEYPTVIEHADWNTGFAILPYMFERFAWPRDMLFAATLLVMGLTLATFYEKRGSLYFIIGLHGGWVLAMRLGGYLLDRHNHVMYALFGHGDIVSKGWLALMVVSLFFVAALLSKKRVEADAQTEKSES